MIKRRLNSAIIAELIFKVTNDKKGEEGEEAANNYIYNLWDCRNSGVERVYR